ncbi:hypothetical protein ACTWP5_29325, partial [Streptomyces sp. 4N509B]|uniref:hypothetical protein n=1 Tax=Streptomyces sp. 4N509B TaxID=3457413 RepID=UPI003FD5F23B
MPEADASLSSASATRDDSPFQIVARARQLTSGNADEALFGFLDASLESVVDRYERDGPQGLREETRSLRRLLHVLLDGRQPPRARHELFRLAARASGLLGYMAVNTGDFLLAQAYCTEAEELSRAIGDLETELWATGTRSLCLYYDGRYRDADACALAAVERSPQAAQTIRLLVNGRARALGKLGERRDAERAIGQALEVASRHDVPAGITPCISFGVYGHARTLANAVTVHVALGNVERVLRYADEIDDLVETSDSSWSRALVRLDVATALLDQPSPALERALNLGVQALELCAGAPIRSVWQRSHELREGAQRWRGDPAVREYDERLRSWSARPAVQAVS